MTSPLSERAQQILRGVELGELDVSAPEVAKHCLEEPALRHALDEWSQLDQLLQDEAADRHAWIEDSSSDARPSDREEVLEFLRRQQADSGPQASSLLRVWVPLAAAAAIVLTALMFRDALFGGDPGGSGPLAQPKDRVLLIPPGPLEYFEIPDELPPGGSMLVEVHDADSPDAEPTLKSKRLRTNRWNLTPAEAALIPEDFRLKVRMMDSDGQRLEAHWYAPESGG